MLNLSQLESSLWEAADQLRANSKRTATEYSKPVLGLIFLRHATNRYEQVKAEIEENLPSRGGKKRAITPEDFKGKAAIYLPPEAHYDHLLGLPETTEADINEAVNRAMRLIEAQVEMRRGGGAGSGQWQRGHVCADGPFFGKPRRKPHGANDVLWAGEI